MQIEKPKLTPSLFLNTYFLLLHSIIQRKESSSPLTTVMLEHGSLEVKNLAAVTEKDSKEYAQLVSYAIVIDVKSTV